MISKTLQQEFRLNPEDADKATWAGAYFMSVDEVGRRAETLWKQHKVSVPMATKLSTEPYKLGMKWAIDHQSSR